MRVMKTTFIKTAIVADHAVAITETKGLDFPSFEYYAYNAEGTCIINWGGFSSVDALMANARIQIPLEVQYRIRRDKAQERKSIVNCIREFEKNERLIPVD